MQSDTPSDQQRKAIEAGLGPVLVVAGPGAGKTYCLIGRVEYLISELGFLPERICAVTFTNKAAEEITVRLHRTLGNTGEDLTRGTLHALCLGILREYGERVGARRGFGIADDSYQRLVLRRLGVNRRRLSQLINLFGRRRLQHYSLSDGDEALHAQYVAELRRKNLVDFDDLIALTWTLFEQEPDIADVVSHRWDYLLVDEFQDLNVTQYAILKRLALRHRNWFAVGDEEQSIFSWTGADPGILVTFREELGVEPIILDHNRRCSRQIFQAARRLLEHNPVLFEKRITADRESDFPVMSVAFPEEDAEVSWLLEDLDADHASSGKRWGDYAILYRQHRVGEFLERHLIRAQVPCRLPRGRALMDDPVIAYVIASARLMSVADEDPVAVEAFAELVLPRHLLEQVGALATPEPDTLLARLRSFASQQPRSDPDTKKAWRFIYHVENLKALYQSHDSLAGLVEELLSQRVGSYRNPLEDRADELTDPAAFPGAAELAGDLARAAAEGGRVWLEPVGGLEVALRGMMLGGGSGWRQGAPRLVSYLEPGDEPGPGDLTVRLQSRGSEAALRLFKALQLNHAAEFGDMFEDFVTFDLETTERDPNTCEVVELGAVKVVGGRVVDRFHSLVRPDRAISQGAREVHGYGEADLVGQPRFTELWPRFRAFVGSHVLVAHNAQGFDVPVLRRMARGLPGVEDLVFFDTLPLARSLFRESARLGDLADRFGIATGRTHHALDDAETLVRVFQALSEARVSRARKAALVNLMDFLGLALALCEPGSRSRESRLMLELARPYTLGRFSDCLEFYQTELMVSGQSGPDLEEVIRRLGGPQVMERIRSQRTAAERYPAAVARLQSLVESSQAPTLAESIQLLLERVALSTSEGVEVDPNRVNLLTLHSTKGLEFSRVYVVGVEDYQLPGYYPTVDQRQDDIEEARRLLYVGMTRAQDRLVLSHTASRFGKPSGGTRFLDEIGLETPSRA
jgi:DNA polymerase III epsilon subunit family exonuclease